MDREDRSPLQLRVADELLMLGIGERPEFDRGIGRALRDQIEERVRPTVMESVPEGERLFVNKHELAAVHTCEANWLASKEQEFNWSATTARGTIVHKALELAVFVEGELYPMELVDHAIGAFREGDQSKGPGEWLNSISPYELAELRGVATDWVAKFIESWPRLLPQWNPRTETGLYVDLCDGKLTLNGKVDLTLGRAQQRQARKLVVDLKTGYAYNNHKDDVRFYSLIETLKVGVPPFRHATFYLDSGEWVHEEVTVELLELAARRTADGVLKMVELEADKRSPGITPGPTCGWCCINETCEGAKAWAEQKA